VNRVSCRRIGLFFVVSVVLLAACAQDGALDTATTSQAVTSTLVYASTTESDDPAESSFESALVELVGDQEGGASAVYEEGGVVEVVTAGVADSEGEQITADTPFHVGSISKTFTATLVMKLVDEGRLDLDAQLSAYMPDIEVGGGSTIRSLLGHRSGIPSYTEHSEFFPAVLGDLTRTWLPTEMLDYVDGDSGDGPQSFSYSNTNFVLLGMLIESLHGKDLNSVLQAEIGQPLGLAITSFAGAGAASPQPAAPFVPDYPESGVAGTPYESVASSAFAAGALVSTPSELRLFLRALLNGELVSESSLAEMTRPQFEYYGLGIEVMDLEEESAWLGHGGAIPGYRSIMAAHPATGQLFVIVTNNELLDPAELVRQFLSSQ
jgi:D-alanyl-D-alanine carboxypeptidase